MKWRPNKVIWRFARDVVNAAVALIRSAQRVPHRGQDGPVGGSLVALLSAAAFIKHRGWGAVIQWHSAGQVLHHFKEGTSRQQARDFDTLPPREPLEAAIRADGVRHFQAREARYGAQS